MCFFFTENRSEKAFFCQELLKRYWILDLPAALGSIYDDVIRKMIAPGKIWYILKVSLMVHVNTKFHDSSQSQLETKVPRFQRRRSLLVPSFLKNLTISDFSKSQIFRLPITFKLVTSSYLNLFNSMGKIVSSWSWRGIFGKDISKMNLFFYFFFSFSPYVVSSVVLYCWIDRYVYFICRS